MVYLNLRSRGNQAAVVGKPSIILKLPKEEISPAADLALACCSQSSQFASTATTRTAQPLTLSPPRKHALAAPVISLPSAMLRKKWKIVLHGTYRRTSTNERRKES